MINLRNEESTSESFQIHIYKILRFEKGKIQNSKPLPLPPPRARTNYKLHREKTRSKRTRKLETLSLWKAGRHQSLAN